MWEWTWRVHGEQRDQCTGSKMSKGESGNDAVREEQGPDQAGLCKLSLAFIQSKVGSHWKSTAEE